MFFLVFHDEEKIRYAINGEYPGNVKYRISSCRLNLLDFWIRKRGRRLSFLFFMVFVIDILFNEQKRFVRQRASKLVEQVSMIERQKEYRQS